MKKFIFFSILSCLILVQGVFAQEVFRKTAPKPGPAPRIQLGKAEQFTLKNGLKVIVVENHKLPRVSFQVFVDVPPFLEGDYAGAADIAGQLLTKGTSTRTKAQIDEQVDFMGASLFSSSGGLTGSCLSKHRGKLLDIMSDVLMNPVFPQEEFDKIKKQTLSALAQAKDDPNTIASNVSTVLLYGKNHPYGEVQTVMNIEKISLDKCKEFYSTYFKPNISYLIVTGDVTLKDVKQLAPKYFDKWQKGEVKKESFPTPQKPLQTQVDFVDKAGAVQSLINIAYPVALKPGTEDVIKASVMNTILGGYFGSRLMSNLRENKAYTYGAGASLNPDPVIGAFKASASVRNEVTDSAIVQFLYELDKLRKEEVPDAELNMVKNYMTGGFARSLERPETVARFALNTARFNLPADYYATYLEKLSKVTKADVLAMAKKYLTPENAHILVVGNKDETSKKLIPFAADKQVNFYDAFGDKIEDAGLVVPEGVTVETILADYLAALGSPANLAAIKNLKMVMSTSIQGMTMETTLLHEEPARLSMTNAMMGNVVQQSIYDGEKGVNYQMGQKSPMEGEQLEDMKIDAHLFPERFYAGMGVKSELKGMELVEGKKAYKIVIEYPSGSKKTHYFDLETSLKIREVEEEQGVVITNDISDYREVNGVKFPYQIIITGAAPFPLKMVTQNVEVNTTLENGAFKIE
jgi:predicted Zn-dependent peptidase